MKPTDIYRIYGTDYLEMTKSLLAASELAARIPAGARIGIKPNLVSPTPAEYGATTHPQVTAGIVEYLQEHGFADITLLEGSWVGDRTADAYEYCGYRALCERYHVPFVDLQRDGSHPVDCAGMAIRVCNTADRIDFLINVPVVKGHGQTKITCALKNLKGLIPNSEKRRFHAMGLHDPIAHLAAGVKQHFIVADHICGDLELEDGGNPITANCVLTALDPVLLDHYVCRLLGHLPEEVPYLGKAAALGAGSGDLSLGRMTTFEGRGTDTHAAACIGLAGYDPIEPARSEGDALVDVRYAIEEADSCSACYSSLAPAILRLKQEGLWEAIQQKLPGKIAIGQGFAGKSGPMGIGRCCAGFAWNVPGCPPREEDVYEALKALL